MSRIPRMGGFGLFDRGRGPAMFLFLVLFVAVGSVAWLSRDRGERRRVDVLDKVQRDPSLDEVRAQIDDDFSPFDPKTGEWGVIDDGSPEGHRRIPTRALAKAAEVTSLASWAVMKLTGSTFDPARTGFPHADVSDLFGSPSRWRGLPVSILGQLEELQDVDLFDRYDFRLPDGRYEAKEGLITARADLHGSSVPVKFTLVDKTDAELDFPVPGEQVKLQGVFFKIQMLDLPNGGVERGLWIIGKRLLRSFQLPDPGTADLSRLQDVREIALANNYDRRQYIFHEQPLLELIAAVQDQTPFANVEPLEMRGKQLQEILARPEEYRGKVIEFKARVLRIEHHSMAAFYEQHEPGDNRVHEFWNLYVTADAALPITILSLTEPPRDLVTSDMVRVRGVFYKNWNYRAGSEKSGKVRIIRSPLLVGLDQLDIVRIQAYTGFDPVVWGVLGFSVLAVIVIALVARADRKRSRLFQDERRAKRQLERGKLDLNAVADEGRET
ncbi:MAG: hypothetical protein KDB53_13590 [Planctomycetes bacterium]|nr:hypothetical protein [Planctomycetota bacterium]